MISEEDAVAGCFGGRGGGLSYRRAAALVPVAFHGVWEEQKKDTTPQILPPVNKKGKMIV